LQQNIRHEHVAHAEVIYNYIKDNNLTPADEIINTLKNFCFTATITHEEDLLLDKHGYKNKMPSGFYNKSDSLFDDHFARYKAVGIYQSLVLGFNNN
jgi:hypothetical protein